MKRPAMQLCSLSLANRYPFADVRQIFQRNTAGGVFSLTHNAFADVVVNPACKAPFFAGKLFQAAAAGLCAFAFATWYANDDGENERY